MSEPQEPRPQSAPQDPSESGQTTTTLERERVVTPELSEPGDHERFAHYVRKEKILDSALSGNPVIALCGKVWLPGRDPSRFPVCPACKEIYDGMKGGGDEDGGSGGPS